MSRGSGRGRSRRHVECDDLQSLPSEKFRVVAVAAAHDQCPTAKARMAAQPIDEVRVRGKVHPRNREAVPLRLRVQLLEPARDVAASDGLSGKLASVSARVGHSSASESRGPGRRTWPF